MSFVLGKAKCIYLVQGEIYHFYLVLGKACEPDHIFLVLGYTSETNIIFNWRFTMKLVISSWC
jgi:hypothetical protein